MGLDAEIFLYEQDLRPFQLQKLPSSWEVSMTLENDTKKHVSYVYAIQNEGEYKVIGALAFDKTDEARFYQTPDGIQTVDDKHWELAIHMHDPDEGMPRYSRYGITMAGLLKTLEQAHKKGIDRLLIRTDETNTSMLALGSRMGAEAYLELLSETDKKGKTVLVPTSGRVFDTRVQTCIDSLKKYQTPNFMAKRLLSAEGR